MSRLQAAMANLTHDDPSHRDLAVEHLGDLLRGATLTAADAELAVTRLIALLANEADPTVRESTLHAIAEAFDRHHLSLPLFEPLRPLLPAMPPALLEHALYILAATHDPQALPTIEAFLQHPDPAVRRYADNALAELSAPGNP